MPKLTIRKSYRASTTKATDGKFLSVVVCNERHYIEEQPEPYRTWKFVSSLEAHNTRSRAYRYAKSMVQPDQTLVYPDY